MNFCQQMDRKRSKSDNRLQAETLIFSNSQLFLSKHNNSKLQGQLLDLPQGD